jgi:hypothetical protein
MLQGLLQELQAGKLPCRFCQPPALCAPPPGRTRLVVLQAVSKPGMNATHTYQSTTRPPPVCLAPRAPLPLLLCAAVRRPCLREHHVHQQPILQGF